MKAGVRFVIFFVLLLVTAFPAAADPGDSGLGSSPYAAQPLSSGLNVGALAAGEAFWYVFNTSDLSNQLDHSIALNMVYKPGEHDVAPYVNFQIFTFNQVDRWLQGYADATMGIGVFATTDFDQETAERLWSGSLLKDEVYYVRVFNNSKQPVEYHLTALSQPEATATETKGSVQPASNVTRASSSVRGLKSGATAAETQWLLVAAAVKNMSTEDAAAWLKMASQVGWLPAAGSGGDNATSTEYFASPAALPGDIPPGRVVPPDTAEAASKAAPAPSLLNLYPNVYPNAPLALHDGANVGKVAPGGEHWYSFIHDDHDQEWYDYMALTLFSTPADGNSSHHINFQIFTGSQLHIWQRGTPQDMRPMGAGQWVSRDKDPATGERLWAGHVVDGDLYYIRVFNHTDHLIDYYLITSDIINTELGDQVWAAIRPNRQVLWQPTSYIRTR